MKQTLMSLYQRLLDTYGPQHWWPAEDPFEVMVGAVLTQNTAWGNVEKAIANLKAAGRLTPEWLLSMERDTLAELIRPSGYYNVKTHRLRNLCEWLIERDGYAAVARWETQKLRESLLNVKGIGPETADDILLYAFHRPVFVIDQYTRRLMTRLGLADGKEDYEALRELFESALPTKTDLYNEYHALIVRHAKEKCTTSEDCRHCEIESVS